MSSRFFPFNQNYFFATSLYNKNFPFPNLGIFISNITFLSASVPSAYSILILKSSPLVAQIFNTITLFSVKTIQCRQCDRK